MQPTLQHYLQEFERIGSNTSALWDKQRKLARDYLLDTGFPTVKDENWRYIARAPILQQLFTVSMATSSMQADLLNIALPEPSQPDTLRLIWLNGCFHLPSATSLPKGLEIKPIHQVMQAHPEMLVEDRFKCAIHLGHSFNALNTMFSQEGVMITVADGLTIEPMIELCYVFSSQLSKSEPTLFCVRNDVRVGKNSAIRLVEKTLNLDDQMASAKPSSICFNTFTTLTLQASAKVSWVQSLRVSDQNSYINQLAVQQQKDSLLQMESLILGGGLVRNTLSVDLCAASASCALRGLTEVKRRHRVDNQITVCHQADDTHSDLHYRYIADDRGQASFSGGITANEGIHRMSSHQVNYNLLLSDYAEVNTQPRLALFADDIQCTHGATVGALDTKALFYLQARGLSEKSARALLIQAFSEVILQMMPTLLSAQKSLSTHLDKAVE